MSDRVVYREGSHLKLDWARKLRPTQARFFFSKATRKIYIGAVGSGKTEILCRSFLDILQRSPGNAGLIGRLHYRDFENSTLITLMELINQARMLHPASRPSDGVLKIHSIDPEKPSTILFAHFDAQEQFGSVNVGLVAIDEIADVPAGVFRFLETRLRLPGLKERYILGSGNPNGHDFYWKIFHPQSPDKLEGYQWFSPEPFENAENLPPNYYEDLIAHNGEEWVSRFVYGNTDTFEGQIYSELSDKVHRKPNNSIPYPPPKEWPRIIGLDHGLRNPTAVGFWTVDFDGNMWCYDEHYEAGKVIQHHAKIIKEKYLEHCYMAKNVDWVADPSIFAKTQSRGGRLYSVSDEYDEHGLSDWMPGENDMVAGRNRVKEYIKLHKLFFLQRCQHHWDEMTRLHWRKAVGVIDQRNPEQEADVDNHCPDAVRYVLMSRPDTPRNPIPKPMPSPKELRKRRTKNLFRNACNDEVQRAARAIRHSSPNDYV